MTGDRDRVRSWLTILEAFLRDLRLGARSLARSPVFTSTVVVTLALGIGANTAIFTLVDAVILDPLPVERPEELYVLGTGALMGTRQDDSVEGRSPALFSAPLYRDFAENSRAFAEMAAISSFPVYAYTGAGDAGAGGGREKVDVRLVSGSFFDVLGLAAARGRLLAADDDRTPGRHPVAVISEGLWQRRFGGVDDMQGETLHLNGMEYSVVGVAPSGFTGVTVGLSTDVWVPMAMQAEIMRDATRLEDRNTMWLRIFGRLYPSVDPAAAAAETNDLYRRLVAEEVGGGELSSETRAALDALETQVTPFARGISPLRQRYSEPLLLLMAVVGFVLLIACANVGNLQLARAATREEEVAIRVALGSSRRRLVGQLLTESLILAILGGAVGLLVGRWTINLLVSLISTRGLPIDVDIDGRVLAFTFSVSLLAALLTGLAPAFRSSTLEPGSALKCQGSSASGRPGGWGLRETLLVAQVAVSLPLLIAAGLFLRSLENLRNQETGFRAEGVVLVEIDPRGGGYEPERTTGLYRDLVDRLEVLPGVKSASVAYTGPMGRGRWVELAYLEGLEALTEDERAIEVERMTPGYFETIGATLIEGRAPEERDGESAPKVAVVNEAFARKFFAGESPVGRAFGITGEDNVREYEIVGLVRNFKQHDLRREVAATAFFPVAQSPTHLESVQVRGAVDLVLPSVRETLAEVAPELPVLRVTKLSDMIETTLRQERMLSRLTTFFGLLALVMASLGLYGVVAYGVARRTREIGIRLALGALRGQVVWTVLRKAMGLVALGVAIGLTTALALGRFLSSLLYDLHPADPTTLAAAGLTLAGVALFAGLLPAHRASQLDPATTLHHD